MPVTGVGDACPEPFRVLESPFPSLMLAWTPATGQAAELPHRAPLGHHVPPLPGGATSAVCLKEPVCDHLPPTEPRTGLAAFGCHVVMNAKLQLAAGPTAGGGATVGPATVRKQGWAGRRGRSRYRLGGPLAAATLGRHSIHSVFLLSLRDWMWRARPVLRQSLGSAPTPETSFLCGAHSCGLAPRSLCLDAGKPELALSEAV